MLPYLLSVVTALGWVGAIIGLIAYLQVSRGRWAPNSLQFQLANLTATSLMFLVAAVNGVWPSVAANVAWMVIGAQALLVLNKARRTRRARAAEAVAEASVTSEPVVPAVATAAARSGEPVEVAEPVESVLDYLDRVEHADFASAPVPAGVR